MNYIVKAFKIVKVRDNTTLENYERSVSNYNEAEKEVRRLKCLGHYVNVTISKMIHP